MSTLLSKSTLIPDEPIFCHPEQSEGSQLSEKTRVFAALRMTIHGIDGLSPA
jgi:hypothetical protein